MPHPRPLFCLLLTSDHRLAASAHDLARWQRVPIVVVHSVEAAAAIAASVVPTHLLVDRRHPEPVDVDVMLGAHRDEVHLLLTEDHDAGLAHLVRIADEA